MTLNFAHRGFSGLYPENTLLAFFKAMELGCDGIELDVHLTKDRQLVVIHDEDVARTTDGKGLVKDLTLEELRRLNTSALYPETPVQRIPTLEEYFDLIQDSSLITNIELKNSIIRYEGMEEQVIALIRARGLADRVIFSSFNHYSMLLCRRLAPEIPCGLLYASWIVDPGAYAMRCGIQYLHPQYCSVTEPALSEAVRAGIPFNVWTVNDQAAMRDMVGKGVHAVITNYPDRLAAILAEHGQTAEAQL